MSGRSTISNLLPARKYFRLDTIDKQQKIGGCSLYIDYKRTFDGVSN